MNSKDYMVGEGPESVGYEKLAWDCIALSE